MGSPIDATKLKLPGRVVINTNPMQMNKNAGWSL